MVAGTGTTSVLGRAMCEIVEANRGGKRRRYEKYIAGWHKITFCVKGCNLKSPET